MLLLFVVADLAGRRVAVHDRHGKI
jgi:hypothetical protein